MLEMLKSKSLFGLVILLVGFTYVKTLPQQDYKDESRDNNLFLYVEEK